MYCLFLWTNCEPHKFKNRVIVCSCFADFGELYWLQTLLFNSANKRMRNDTDPYSRLCFQVYRLLGAAQSHADTISSSNVFGLVWFCFSLGMENKCHRVSYKHHHISIAESRHKYRIQYASSRHYAHDVQFDAFDILESFEMIIVW